MMTPDQELRMKCLELAVKASPEASAWTITDMANQFVEFIGVITALTPASLPAPTPVPTYRPGTSYPDDIPF